MVANDAGATGPAPMIKANHNTVVVVAESVTQRPAAAEARRRRKEILLKQEKSKSNMAAPISNAASISNANGGNDAIVVDHNAAAEAATLAAVVAAAAAAVDASVDLVSTEAIDNAVNAITPTGTIDMLAQHGSSNNDIDESISSAVSAAGAIDIPFLEDAVIAATAAAVAMNSVTTDNSNSNAITTVKKKAPKRKRQADKNKTSNDAVDENNDSFDDYNDIDNEDEDCYDEFGHPLSASGGNKKTQIRYDPSIPMEKEQLAAWRREARRVRNRESAAASRQRIRGRIAELEDELDVWKQKYHAAMTTLQQVQSTHQSGTTPQPP